MTKYEMREQNWNKFLEQKAEPKRYHLPDSVVWNMIDAYEAEPGNVRATCIMIAETYKNYNMVNDPSEAYADYEIITKNWPSTFAQNYLKKLLNNYLQMN